MNKYYVISMVMVTACSKDYCSPLLFSTCEKNFSPKGKNISCVDDMSCVIISDLEPKINAAVGCTIISREIKKDFEPLIVQQSTELVKECAEEINEPAAIGCYHNGKAFFEETNEVLVGSLITLHEMGHSFGLGHEAGTIMNSNLLSMTEEEAINSLAYLLNKHNRLPCE